MMKKKWMVAVSLCAVSALFSVSASAKEESKAEKKAEAKMMKACKKDYPDAVKAKSAKEVSEWVEAEEHGANADTFKKSKCFNLHEDWEKVAGNEEGEKEHKN